jgi:cobalamin biosynthesis protein CobT
VPGKRDYHVVIGLDVSGSTWGGRLKMIKRAALAQAELLHRTGVKFEIWAHTGNYHVEVTGSTSYGALDLDVACVKELHEPWDDRIKNRLATLKSSLCNLDGHTLEFYRKQLDKGRATDRVIMYYTDGAMPAENYTEELHVLLREIKECQRRGYTLLAVGVNNSEPAEFGLDTVRLDTIEDVAKVVAHLGKRLVS